MKSYKKDFPFFNQSEHFDNDKSPVYLDNAATSQKPQKVIDVISDYYIHNNANIHRGIHWLSDKSTHLFSEAKVSIANFFNATSEELIFTSNTTEAINAVAQSWGDNKIDTGDTIVTTLMEHHANIVPWQKLCQKKKANLEYISLTDNGLLKLDHLNHLLKSKTVKLVTLTHVSNVLGTQNSIKKVVDLVKTHDRNIKILVDGAQYVPHKPLNFKELNCDFYAFSGHKMFGPMGIGGLLVKKELLENNEFEPWLFGGGMIDRVYKDQTTFNKDLSQKFVAGTPDVASIVGLREAVRYILRIGWNSVIGHERELMQYCYDRLNNISEISIIGPEILENRIGSLAFLYQGVHAHDVAQVLSDQKIAVRSGHHCCQPLHDFYRWKASVRVSFQLYNDKEDIDRLIEGLSRVKKVFI